MYKKREIRLKKLGNVNCKQTDKIFTNVDNLLSDPKANEKVIRDQLVEKVVLEAQLEDSYKNSKSHKIKNTIAKILAGKIVKKYKLFSTFKKNIAPAMKNTTASPKSILSHRKPLSKPSQRIKKSVEEFILSNSTIDPGKKSCKTINGQIYPLHYLNSSLFFLLV